MVKQNRGFTVLEVMLFLGVTGLLLLIIFIGTGGLARDTRFNDSMNSLQSFIQRQYDEVANGVNTSTTGPSSITICGSNTQVATRDCLLVGKTIKFDATGTVKTNFVITKPLPENYDTIPGSIYTKMATLNPEEKASDTYEINWGARFVSGKTKSPIAPINSVAFIRSTESNRIFTYLYNDVRTIKDVIGSVPVSQGSICINNPSDLVASLGAIEFIDGEGAGGITTNFAPGSGQC